MSQNRSSLLKVGLSSCIMHADPTRAIFKGKTLLYLVEQMSDWLLLNGMMACLIPSLPKNSKVVLEDYVNELDALILQGGADVAPESYGETPLRPEWSGDRIRDVYEIELIQKFREQKKPVLGICRGLQILNVALGGSLYQDITEQVSGSLVHRNWDIYDQNFHTVELLKNSSLANLYGGPGLHMINSVHHQGIKDLAPCLNVEAVSKDDGIIEAVRSNKDDFVMGVQWHPEFQGASDTKKLISPEPLLSAFSEAIKASRSQKS